MTGFGSGRSEVNGFSVYAEISTVNRKQLEIRFSLPRELAGIENELRKLLQEKLSRGMVSVRLSQSSSGRGRNSLNHERVSAIIEAANLLSREYKLKNKLTVTDILSMPGVFEESLEETPADLKQAAQQALTQALQALESMRSAEGETLKVELEKRLEFLEEMHRQLLPEVAGIEAQIKQRLLDKLAAAGLGIDLQDERLLKEVLYYADKADVTEELTRLDSHFAQFRNFLNGAAGGGRSMDFLVQEMFREITTLGNKAGSGPVAAVVVKFKTELEKIREQIQNIE